MKQLPLIILTMGLMSNSLAQLPFGFGSAKLSLYMSKQTKEFTYVEGNYQKKSDEFESGNCVITREGPINYYVAPAPTYGPNDSIDWTGNVKPDVYNGPTPGSSAPAKLIGDYSVYYSKPGQFAGTQRTCDAYYIDAQGGVHDPHGCGGFHTVVNKTGKGEIKYNVVSIKNDIPEDIPFQDNIAHVHASTYPYGEGTVYWQTPAGFFTGKDITFSVNPNQAGKEIISTLEVEGITYTDTGQLIQAHCDRWLECPPGKWIMVPPGTVCLRCDSNNYITGPVGTVCMECPDSSKSFSAQSPSNKCKQCPENSGKYQIMDSTYTCIECPSGSGKNTIGPIGLACLECPDGSGNFITGDSGDVCIECPTFSGKYVAGQPGSNCVRCPPGASYYVTALPGELCCNGEMYDPTKQKCLSCWNHGMMPWSTKVGPLTLECCVDDGVVIYYDSAIDQCLDCGSMAQKRPKSWLCCGGVAYDPAESTCFSCGNGQRVAPKTWTGCCNGFPYDPSLFDCVAAFCNVSYEHLVAKGQTECCGGRSFDPTKDQCVNCGSTNSVWPIGWECCGGTMYNPNDPSGAKECITCGSGRKIVRVDYQPANGDRCH
jgi:hypothetical protein